jgi:hypothetical protein
MQKLNNEIILIAAVFYLQRYESMAMGGVPRFASGEIDLNSSREQILARLHPILHNGASTLTPKGQP